MISKNNSKYNVVGKAACKTLCLYFTFQLKKNAGMTKKMIYWVLDENVVSLTYLVRVKHFRMAILISRMNMLLSKHTTLYISLIRCLDIAPIGESRGSNAAKCSISVINRGGGDCRVAAFRVCFARISSGQPFQFCPYP